MSSSSGTTSAASSPSSERSFLTRSGHFIFKYRDLLFPVVLLTLGFGTWPRLARGDMAADHLLDAAGIAVALAGQSLRVLVIGLEYIVRGGLNRQVWANTLVDGGMFAHCRNPLYVGNLLIVTGLAMVHNGWAMYAIALPLFLYVYVAIVSAEEEYLRERFGEPYVEYCRRVPRWIPRVRGMPATLREGRFDWLKVLRKEYGTPFAWMSGALVLMLWEHRSPGAPPIGDVELGALVGVWVVLATAWFVTRTLKLRGRIGTT